MGKTIHFIGIGGVGMSGIARVLARQGLAVTGSDMQDSPTLTVLHQEYGIRTAVGHAAANLNGATSVVVSAAIKRDNPELKAAHALGLPILSRAQMLGQLMAHYPRSIAVTGTHGKTTTTGMIAMALEAGGLDPTVLIGGNLAAYGGNARLGQSDVFVAEACEAYDSFIELDPWIGVVTNLEADHLDYYGDLDNIQRSFRKFLSQVTGTAILCAEDANVRALAVKNASPRMVTYGLQEGVYIRACDVQLDGLHPRYVVCACGKTLGQVTLNVPGSHNVLDSLAAVAVGLELDIPFAQITAGLERFTGAGRRFERLGENSAGVLVIDDYAHHPTEIRATLAAARQAYPKRRLVAVFQPHLPSRTSDFKAQFAESFSDADIVVLTDIYLAREQPIEGVTGAGLAALTADRRGAAHVTYVADKNALPSRLSEIVQPGDLIITLGAGDIRKAGEDFLKQ